jgi:hypothetical protein
MNVITREIYVGQEAIDAAKARGETVIELSDGIVKHLVSLEEAQARLDGQEAIKRAFALPQVSYREVMENTYRRL